MSSCSDIRVLRLILSTYSEWNGSAWPFSGGTTAPTRLFVFTFMHFINTLMVCCIHSCSHSFIHSFILNSRASTCIAMSRLNSSLLHHHFHPDLTLTLSPTHPPPSSPALLPLGAAWGDATGFTQWCLQNGCRRPASAPPERLPHSHRLWCDHARAPVSGSNAAGTSSSDSSPCDIWGEMRRSREPITAARVCIPTAWSHSLAQGLNKIYNLSDVVSCCCFFLHNSGSSVQWAKWTEYCTFCTAADSKLTATMKQHAKLSHPLAAVAVHHVVGRVPFLCCEPWSPALGVVLQRCDDLSVIVEGFRDSWWV